MNLNLLDVLVSVSNIEIDRKPSSDGIEIFVDQFNRLMDKVLHYLPSLLSMGAPADELVPRRHPQIKSSIEFNALHSIS